MPIVIKTDSKNVAAILRQVAAELPALLESGETGSLELNGTKDGRVFRQVKRSSQLAADMPGAEGELFDSRAIETRERAGVE